MSELLMDQAAVKVIAMAGRRNVSFSRGYKSIQSLII